MPQSTADINALTDFSGAHPFWLRVFNGLGRPLRRFVSLDATGLMAAARKRTGLSDFGSDDDFEAPMRCFVGALDEEAQLSLMGRLLVRRDVYVLLCNRLQIAETLRANPEILDVPIREPLFIVGLSRSGTSILHELLAQDPAHRTLETWEARYPCPPPIPGQRDSDPRFRRAHRELTFWHQLVPPYKSMHENGGHLPAECGDITCHAFLGDRLPALHQVPSYAAHISTLPIKPAYDMHKKILQILQWKHRRDRWLLKAPAHMSWLDTLFEVYPDARIVQTHRDPLQIMGSTVSLIAAIMWMRAERLDPELLKLAFGPAYYEPQLYRVMQQRDSGIFPENAFHDVRFQDLMDAPWTIIEGVYSHFGWQYTDQARSRMKTYLENKPRGKHGKHSYSFHDLGLDLGTERARYRAYQERYDVKSEVS
jgi:hypothetical protein